MTLNYQVIVERYPFPNGVVGGLIPAVKSSLYLTEEEKKTSQVSRKPRAHPSQGRTTGFKFTLDCPTLVTYLFICISEILEKKEKKERK
jgi:hypothetical protein